MSGYDNYDISDDDNCIDGSTCLKNHLGLTDTARLDEAEGNIVNLALAQLEINAPFPLTWDFTHLQHIHEFLFKDIYPFAGRVRSVEVSKGGILFLPHSLILNKANSVFSKLQTENLLSGLSVEDFGDRCGYYLGQINLIHPFREGNGRTQRAFLDQLAKKNGYRFIWSAVSGEAMSLACREARMPNGSDKKLRRLLRLNITDKIQ